MKTLYESIMAPDLDITQGVEVEAVLKKYHWYQKRWEWAGNTLKVYFDGRGYMRKFNEVVKELGCTSFEVYPWAIIESVDKLENIHIKAGTRLDIYCSDIKNCSLESNYSTTISPKKGDVLKISGTHFGCSDLKVEYMDKFAFKNNDFSNVDRLALTHIGPGLTKIVNRWDLADVSKERWSYKWPPKDIDKSLDPLKELGLDKYFKDLDKLVLCGDTYGSDYKIVVDKQKANKFAGHDIRVSHDLDNGYQIRVESDARSLYMI